jgi:hypothetical protein
MRAGVVCVSVTPPTSQTKETSRTFSICRPMWKTWERPRCGRLWNYYVIREYLNADLGYCWVSLASVEQYSCVPASCIQKCIYVLSLNISLNGLICATSCSAVHRFTSRMWSSDFFGEPPLVGARPVKPWVESSCSRLGHYPPFHPHITPDIFDVVLRSRGAQLGQWVSGRKKE